MRVHAPLAPFRRARWFVAPSTGFNVSNAPTAAGPVSYQVAVGPSPTKSATYSVVTTGSAAVAATLWTMRWPGAVSEPACAVGCTVHAADPGTGLITVLVTAARFTVSASWATTQH